MTMQSLTYVPQLCPECHRSFKVPWITQPKAGIPQLCHCPYCQHEGDNFLTEGQKTAALSAAKKLAGDFIKGALKGRSAPPPSGETAFRIGPEETPDLPNVASFACCDGSIQHDATVDELYCPFCGKPNAATAT